MKQQVSQRHDKTALKQVMQAGNKVMQWSAQDYETEEVGPYNTILLSFNPSIHIRTSPLRPSRGAVADIIEDL